MKQGGARVTGVIGIDCATQARKTGLALGCYEGGVVRLEQVLAGSMVTSVVGTVAAWTARIPCTLVALDAPLGWPADLGPTLQEHEAGRPIAVNANLMFRRTTDGFVKREIGKQPLDVGANWIARTAHAALVLLDELRQRTGEAIPLAWDPATGAGIHAIEVYPAATLKACGVEVPGYKGTEDLAARQAILRFLDVQMHLPEDVSLLEQNDDALDAALCVLAGVDFLRGRAVRPADLELARKEGWIWVRRPGI